MPFIDHLFDFGAHFLGSIFHLLGLVLVLMGVFKLVHATEKGDVIGLGLKSVMFLILGMFCLSV